MEMKFTNAIQKIADRWNRMKGVEETRIGSMDAEAVKYHAYKKVSRCSTIRLIARGCHE